MQGYCQSVYLLVDSLCEKLVESKMQNWAAYRTKLNERSASIAAINPDILKGSKILSEAAPASPSLSPKMRELIALAVADAATRCDGCIAFHSDLARKAGATREELAEALRSRHRTERRGGSGLFGARHGRLRDGLSFGAFPRAPAAASSVAAGLTCAAIPATPQNTIPARLSSRFGNSGATFSFAPNGDRR